MNRITLVGGPLDGVEVKSPAGDNPLVGYELWFDLEEEDNCRRRACYTADASGIFKYSFTLEIYDNTKDII